MAIVYTKQKNGVTAVYDQTSTWGSGAKKSRTKRKYIGHLDQEGNFVPSSGKRGRPPKAKDISKPVQITKEEKYELKIAYLEAEIRRLKSVLKQIQIYTKNINELIEPSLEENLEKDAEKGETA